MSDNKHSLLQLIETLVDLLSSGSIQRLQGVWKVFLSLFPHQDTQGLYEILDYDCRLELLDTKGEKALHYKKQQVQFLQNDIVTYQDQAWGDGEIFDDYRCSPGSAVDRYREGYRYRVLISLRETKNRGDKEEIFIERTIRHGFTKEVEDLQTEITHPTQNLTITVVFPLKRPPRQVTLIERNSRRTTALGSEYRRFLPDGREQITWSLKKPKLFELYILLWEW